MNKANKAYGMYPKKKELDVGRCNNYAVLPNISCLKECRIVGQLLVDHALTTTADVLVVYLQQFWKTVKQVPNVNETICFMVDKEEITDTMDMFCSTLKIPVETPEQPFIPPATLKFIQPFLKIVGYQGLVNKFKSIPKKLEEEYHAIKHDTPLVSVYTTRKVNVKGMLIPNNLIIDEIRDTQEYKDYVEEFGRVDVPMIQPQPIESTKGTHRTPNPTDVVQKKRKGTPVAGETINEKILEGDVEKIKEGEDEESYASEFANLVFLHKEDSCTRLETRSHKRNPETVDDDDDDVMEKKDDKKDNNDDDNNDDHDDYALNRT
ncbi:hypothetical protein Tco_0678324 [Tanacetum coccineum]|uniref:Uncharacterized protein n=1 Tax=Tanacetum coccineum TaxID=301880 RepID=A0ABQ4XFW9_9ASTR